MVTNLLSSAVEHTTASGQIRVRDGNEADGALLDVRDSGPPIPVDVLPRIFERPQSTRPPTRRRARCS